MYMKETAVFMYKIQKSYAPNALSMVFLLTTHYKRQ